VEFTNDSSTWTKFYTSPNTAFSLSNYKIAIPLVPQWIKMVNPRHTYQVYTTPKYPKSFKMLNFYIMSVVA